MAELICGENDGSLSFGDFSLPEKQKADNFAFEGDLYKVKTFSEITKLERNGMFVYESVPGTRVSHFMAGDDEVSFTVKGQGDAQITVGLEEETEYDILVDGSSIGTMKTNLGGKLSFNVESGADTGIYVSLRRK